MPIETSGSVVTQPSSPLKLALEKSGEAVRLAGVAPRTKASEKLGGLASIFSDKT